MHRRRDQPDRGADDIEIDLVPLFQRRGRRHAAASRVADDRDADHQRGGHLDWHDARKQGSEQDRDIGPGLDQPGAAEYLIGMEMLRQDRVFDRAEEGRMDAHREQGEEHQRSRERIDRDALPGEQEAGRADEHDHDLAEFDDPDHPRLVARIGELARQSGQEEEGQDEDRGGERAEPEFRAFVAIHLVDDEQDHRVLEQIVVERAEHLGCEQRQEAPRSKKMERIGHRRSWVTHTGNKQPPGSDRFPSILSLSLPEEGHRGSHARCASPALPIRRLWR